MNRAILHSNYSIEYKRTPDRTEITVYSTFCNYADAFDDAVSYGADKDMTLLDISHELLAEIRKYLRVDPDADSYYSAYTRDSLHHFVDALLDTIRLEKGQ